MVYMIIERFYPDKVKLLYERFAEKGRMMPDGVQYINSWIDPQVSICYQVMESDSHEKILEWSNNWAEFAEFEIIPVISSAQAREIVFSR